MSSSKPRPTQDSGFRQIIDSLAQQRAQIPQKPEHETTATVFNSSASAFRYLGHLMSGR
jgi:hypothetical protein